MKKGSFRTILRRTFAPYVCTKLMTTDDDDKRPHCGLWSFQRLWHRLQHIAKVFSLYLSRRMRAVGRKDRVPGSGSGRGVPGDWRREKRYYAIYSSLWLSDSKIPTTCGSAFPSCNPALRIGKNPDGGSKANRPSNRIPSMPAKPHAGSHAALASMET